MKKYLQEIDQRLLRLTKKKSISKDGMKRIGLTVPKTRAALKTPFSFSDLDENDQLKIWDYIWNNTKYFESMSLCLYYYQGKVLSKSEFTKLASWVNRVNC